MSRVSFQPCPSTLPHVFIQFVHMLLPWWCCRDGAEQLSVDRALRALSRAEVVVMVVDGSDGVTQQVRKGGVCGCSGYSL